ncbi:MAG TPA: AcvB/VirJ family lysyl-phosphatidylglycerol hydrolase [Stenotrophomonas sp.]
MLKFLPRALFLTLLIPVASAAATLPVAPAAQTVSHGRFEQVPVLRPAGPAQRVVIWFAGASSDTAARQRKVMALRDDGALVAVVDTARLYQILGKDPGKCVFSSGDVDNFSRYLQAFLHVETYHLPLLVGDGEGAALAYAVAAQAPAQTFAGVLTDGLCPAQVPVRAVCGSGVDATGQLVPAKLPIAWLAAAPTSGVHCAVPAREGFAGQVAQARTLGLDAHGDLLPGLLAAARSLGAQPGVSLPPPPSDLQGLPIVEVPALVGQPGNEDLFAIFVSGDGGWAGLDKQVAARLSQSGIPVVGVDSLRYFWNERTPAGFATDLDRIMRFYSHRWQRSRVVLIGFSQGADVLPAAINRLPEGTRDTVAMTALLSVGQLADYEFHVSNWLGGNGDGLPIAPEVARLDVARTICIYGQGDPDALCPLLPAQGPRRIALPGDHHFKGDYAVLAQVILDALARTPPR